MNTKQVFFSLLISIFIAQTFHAQERAFNIGPRIGANLSNLDTENIQANENSITGFTAGVFLEIYSSTAFSFQAELLYSEQGSEIDSELFTDDLNLDYLQAPLLAKFRFLDILNLHAGPQIGFITNDLENYDVESLDLSSVVGFGLEVGALRADLRYHYGFRESIQSISAKNRYYSVTIAYELL